MVILFLEVFLERCVYNLNKNISEQCVDSPAQRRRMHDDYAWACRLSSLIVDLRVLSAKISSSEIRLDISIVEFLLWRTER